MAQCDDDVYEVLSLEDLPLEKNGSTLDSEDNFIVIDGGTGEPVSGYASTDRIYKFNLGLSDENGDGENDEAINLFVDLCRTGTTFDATVAIVKTEGIDCQNVDIQDLIVSNPNELGTTENIDGYALCPPLGIELSEGISAWYLPVARDIFIDEPGDYYIVIEAFSEGQSGDYNMLIGEMAHFTEYSIHPQNIFLDINFSDFVYGVNDNPSWSLGTIDNVTDYFELMDEIGNDISIGTNIDSDGNT